MQESMSLKCEGAVKVLIDAGAVLVAEDPRGQRERER